ncbi:MAG: hypothetical protein JSV50_04390 [Desulfobacteraceae bacterium]|nr:MAG: hypothetical protein JSV50_04390 [Desulfobacteraceae bacterium]
MVERLMAERIADKSRRVLAMTVHKTYEPINVVVTQDLKKDVQDIKNLVYPVILSEDPFIR